MKRLIYIAMLLLACKGNPVGVEFEPYRIGNWEFVTQDSARFVGGHYKSVGDTTLVESNRGFASSVWESFDTSDMNFLFTDSTANYLEWRADSVDFGSIEVRPTGNPSTQPYIFNGLSSGMSNNVFYVETGMIRRCDAPITGSNNIIVTIYRKNGDTYKNWLILADGFKETFNEIACN